MSTSASTTSHPPIVYDLFGGAGGFALGAHVITDDVVSYEIDPDACATQRAAGMYVIEGDVRDAPIPTMHSGSHLHASPPCTTFSNAGRGHGRNSIETLSAAVLAILDGRTPDDLDGIDETTLLVLEPARWIYEGRPDTVSMEQVRAVLPVWEAYAEGMRHLGYSVWTELIHAEQYGVPQTRVRAFLGASLRKEVSVPVPTHSKYHTRKPERLDPGVDKWVSMADALDRGMTARPSHTLTAGGTGRSGAEPFGNGARQSQAKEEEAGRWREGSVGFPRKADHQETATIDGAENAMTRLSQRASAGIDAEKARSWRFMLQGGAGGEGRPRPDDMPAPTLSAKGTATVTDDPDNNWHGRENRAARDAANATPATTIQGDPRVWPRGHKVNQADIDRLGEAEAKAKYGDRAGSGARRISIEEAAVLQGFPADYPWQGSKTSQFRQCGNAIPPTVAETVLRSLLGTVD